MKGLLNISIDLWNSKRRPQILDRLKFHAMMRCTLKKSVLYAQYLTRVNLRNCIIYYPEARISTDSD